MGSRIVLAIVVVGASAAASLAAIAVPAPASASATWSTPSDIDINANNAFLSVSCPSASFCAVVDDQGNALTYNGTSWSAPAAISPYRFQGVSCASESFCVAVDDGNDAYTFNGTSWSGPAAIPTTPPPLLENIGIAGPISCPSPSFCMVLFPGAESTYNGTSWSGLTMVSSSQYSLKGVSCTSASFCVVVDAGGDAYTYNGTSWSAPIDINGSNVLGDVSCPSTSFCMASGDGSSPNGGSGPGTVITYNGSSWSAPATAPNDAYYVGVSCASASFCAAIDGSIDDAFTYNGTTWSTPVQIDDWVNNNYLENVSCASESFCVAVDNNGNAVTYSGGSSPPPPPPACNSSDHALSHIVGPSAVGHAIPSTNLGFTPVASPVRVADTRTGATDPAAYAGDTLCPGGSLTIDMPSSVPTGAGAIVAQLTAITPAAAGFLTVFPAGTTRPGTANVNFASGQVVGNLVTVGLGADPANGAEAVTVYNGSGSNADFTLDLYGYYAPQSTGSGDPYVPLPPARIFATRAGLGEPGAGETLSGGGSVQVPVTGVGGVPTTGVSAVVVNIAVTDTTAPSFLQGYPTGSPPSGATPTVNETWVAGETLSTKAIIGVGSGGSITLANHAGSADVIIDVDGYFGVPGATGALFNALSPVRLLDTRPGGVPGGTSASATVAGAQGVPANAVAGVLDVVDIASGANFLTVYPAGQSTPVAVDVNWVPGDTYDIVDNASYATVGSGGAVGIYNGPSGAATANVVVDEFGYFAG